MENTTTLTQTTLGLNQTSQAILARLKDTTKKRRSELTNEAFELLAEKYGVAADILEEARKARAAALRAELEKLEGKTAPAKKEAPAAK